MTTNDGPGIIRRWWPYSLVSGLVAAGIGWAIGGPVAGGVAGIIVFAGGFLMGWELSAISTPRRGARPSGRSNE